jgi:hypothetical protein
MALQFERKPHSELLDALEGFDKVTMGAGVRVVSLSRRRELMRTRAEAARKRRVRACCVYHHAFQGEGRVAPPSLRCVCVCS